MPPKAKVTKNDVIQAAIEIIQRDGLEKLSVRSLASVLQCSTQPILYLFATMEEIKQIAYHQVDQEHSELLMKGATSHSLPFIGIGLAYIDYAQTKKYLFAFLFMSNFLPAHSLLHLVESEQGMIFIQNIATRTHLGISEAKKLFINYWLTMHGIASMVATNAILYSHTEVEEILTRTYTALLAEFHKL